MSMEERISFMSSMRCLPSAAPTSPQLWTTFTIRACAKKKKKMEKVNTVGSKKKKKKKKKKKRHQRWEGLHRLP